MKLFVLIIESVIFIFFYNYVFNDAFLGIIIIIFANILIFKNYKIDKNYNKFIKLINENEFNDIDEAVNEFKQSKKYFFRLFNKRNSDILSKIKEVKMTKIDVNRFIEIQNKKNDFILKSYQKRLKLFILNIIFLILSFIPLFLLRKFTLEYFFNLYNHYMFTYLFSLNYIFLHIYILYKLTKINKEDISLFDNYSLCFHQNVLDILKLNDSRLTFDKKGLINEIILKDEEDIKIDYIVFLPLILSLIFMIFL